MIPRNVIHRSFLILIVVLSSGSPGTGAAQGIQTISHGEQVDIMASLVPGKLTLIDFYADWCGPCRSLAPTLDRLANANPDKLAIKKIDIVDWESAVAAQYRIQSIPHLKLFDEDGRLLAEGNSGHVMGVLKSRIGRGQSSLRPDRSPVPIFLVGVLAAIGIFLLLRGRVSPDTPVPLSSPGSPAAPAHAAGWFVMMQNSLEGPFSEEDLEELVRRRKIPGKAKARRKGQSTWTTIEEVIEHLM